MNQQNMWNERFSKEGFMYGQKPNAYIQSHTDLIKPKGEVLCLAEGEGRNAVYLAGLGFSIEALDASDVGLDKLSSWAKEHQLEIKTTHIDLNVWQPQKQYDAIVASFMHLPEPLRSKTFTQAIAALAPQGCMIMEFFSHDQMLKEYTSGGPKMLELLYTVDELSPLFERDDIKLIELIQEEDTLDEGWGHQGKASLIRLIAKKI